MHYFFIILISTLLLNSCDRRGYHELELYGKSGELNVVIESEAGKTREVDYLPEYLKFASPIENGVEQKYDFFAFPFNWGFLPSTFVKQADGKETQIDCIVFGDNLVSSSVEPSIAFAMVEIGDSTQIKNRIVLSLPMKRGNMKFYPQNLQEFETKYPVLKQILTLWLENFNAKNWKIVAWKDKNDAMTFIKQHYRKTV